MASDDEARWRRELAPWLGTLRERLWVQVPPLPSREQMRSVWFALDGIQDADVAAPSWTRILEALELLDLLVRVDADVGWEILLDGEIVEDNLTFRLNEEELFPRDKVLPRYQLQLDERIMASNPQQVFLALRRMIGDDDAPWIAQSTEFLRAKQLLLDEWIQSHDGREFDRAREGRIQIQLRFTLTDAVRDDWMTWIVQRTEALAKANAVLASTAVKPTAGTPEERQWLTQCRRAQFQFAAVEFNLHRCVLSPTRATAELLAMASSKSLPLTKISLDGEAMSQIDRGTTWKSISNAIGASMECEGGVQSLEIYTGKFSRAGVASLSSAISQSRSLSRLKLTDIGFPGHQDRAIWWPWLAYAVFSADRNHRLESVAVNVGDMDKQDISTFRQILEHPNPLSFVSSLDESEPSRAVLESPLSGVTLQPGMRVTVGHHSSQQLANDPGVEVAISDEQVYPVVRENADENFVEIVVVGVGVGWINRDAIVSRTLIPRRAKRPIKRLRLADIKEDAMKSVLELLQIIGGDLDELALSSSATMTSSFLDRVCVLCPGLKGLRLRGFVDSFNWLHSPASHHESPRCRLEKVMLDARITDHESFLQLFTALRDSDHPLTKSLREFSFDSKQWYLDKSPQFCEIGERWTDMLSKNWRLERSEFVYYDNDDEEEPDPFTEAYRAHNGEQIFVPQATAFWSVTRRGRIKRQRLETDSARYQLHEESVLLILELAGVPLRRICV